MVNFVKKNRSTNIDINISLITPHRDSFKSCPCDKGYTPFTKEFD